MRLNHYVAFLVGLSAAPGFAASAPAKVTIHGVSLLSEDDTPADRACNVSHASVVATVTAALGERGIETISAPSGEGTFQEYVNFIALQNGQVCAASYTVAFRLYGTMSYGRSGKLLFGPLETCFRAGMMSGPPTDLQDRLNDRFKRFTAECIAETERMQLEDKR